MSKFKINNQRVWTTLISCSLKNSDLDISVLQKYNCAIQMRVVVYPLRMKKSAEMLIEITPKIFPLEESVNLIRHRSQELTFIINLSKVFRGTFCLICTPCVFRQTFDSDLPATRRTISLLPSHCLLDTYSLPFEILVSCTGFYSLEAKHDRGNHVCVVKHNFPLPARICKGLNIIGNKEIPGGGQEAIFSLVFSKAPCPSTLQRSSLIYYS